MQSMQSLTSALFSSISPPSTANPSAQNDSNNDDTPCSDEPTLANFSSENIVIGAGVAIFHIASARVVLCWHPRDEYWFLPKGRRDVNEESGEAAEREGWEESGYRNRLLPTPQPHRQPHPHPRPPPSSSLAETLPRQMVIEPVWTQLVPQTRSTQYLLFWYIAETLPPALDFAVPAPPLSSQEKPVSTSSAAAAAVNGTGLTFPQQRPPYQRPTPYPPNLTIAQRITLEPEGYEPIRHENTGVGPEEKTYKSFLVPVDEAVRKLEGTVMADVVRRGWRGIRNRRFLEEKAGKGEGAVGGGQKGK